MTENIIPLFVAVPLAAAFVIPMVSRKLKWMPDLLGNASMFVLVLLAFMTVGREGSVPYHMGGWKIVGIELRLDGLSSLMLLTVNLIGLVATIYSVQYMRIYTSKLRYYSLFLLMVAGMNGVVLTGDIFNLYVFMEVAAIASYALVAFGCEHEELEASFKYAVLGSVASSLILIGIAVTYALTGTLNMTQIASRLGDVSPDSAPLMLALGLFISGFGLKAALVPFHAWLPDAHPSAPAPISAMLSGVVIKAIGVYVIARLVFNVFGGSHELLAILRYLGVLSMVVGVFLAVGQWDMKRLFAYHSISQIGYVILGLGLGTPLGIAGGLFHMLNHSIFKSLLFLNAGAVEHATGTRGLKELGGLSSRMPVTTATSVVASMSIAGIPPFNGFWSKLIIVLACVEAGHYGMAAWAVIVSLLTLASFLKVQRYAFFDAMKDAVRNAAPAPVLMSTAMIVLAILCAATAFLVISGFEHPVVVGTAVDALKNVFSAEGMAR
jgi:multicomponent Na+:H+ antiporter subunit D